MAAVTITSKHVVSYLDKLAKIGVYGSKPGTVATHIVRAEIMRLVEAGVLNQVEFADDDDDD